TRADILNFQGSFPTLFSNIIAHRAELHRERLLVMGRDSGVESGSHNCPWPKTLRERPVENPDFARILMLVRPMAINYSFWSQDITRADVLPPATQAGRPSHRWLLGPDRQVPAYAQPARLRLPGRLRATVQ